MELWWGSKGLTGELPVELFLEDVAVDHWTVGLGERGGLVLHAEHGQVCAAIPTNASRTMVIIIFMFITFFVLAKKR